VRRTLLKSAFRRIGILVGALALLCTTSSTQNPQLETRNGRQFPTIVFTSVLWSADPSYYSVAIDSSGAATYQSAPSSVGRTGVPYTVEFSVTEHTRSATFNLAHGLDWFTDAIPLSIGAPQETYVRTLAYHDIQFNNLITYSASQNHDVQELTSIFEEISETLEFGRRLAYLHQNQPKALGPELQKLQAMADEHHLRELQALITALSSIASDRKVEEGSRQVAEKLLDEARAASHG
jgi:hypothetical protein